MLNRIIPDFLPFALRVGMRSSPVWQLQHPSGEPYLTRWVLFGADCLENHDPDCKLHAFVHEIHTRDSDRDLHSHPWSWSTAVILHGGYTERRYDSAGGQYDRTYAEGDINILRHGDYHSIIDVEPDTVTLFISGAEISDWGFLVSGTHVAHKDYFQRMGGAAMKTVKL